MPPVASPGRVAQAGPEPQPIDNARSFWHANLTQSQELQSMTARWTDNEKRLLSQHYHAIGARDLTKLLAGRNESAIFHMAQKIGVKKCHDRLRELGAENVRVRWDK